MLDAACGSVWCSGALRCLRIRPGEDRPQEPAGAGSPGDPQSHYFHLWLQLSTLAVEDVLWRAAVLLCWRPTRARKRASYGSIICGLQVPACTPSAPQARSATGSTGSLSAAAPAADQQCKRAIGWLRPVAGSLFAFPRL